MVLCIVNCDTSHSLDLSKYLRVEKLMQSKQRSLISAEQTWFISIHHIGLEFKAAEKKYLEKVELGLGQS